MTDFGIDCNVGTGMDEWMDVWMGHKVGYNNYPLKQPCHLAVGSPQAVGRTQELVCLHMDEGVKQRSV